LKGGKILRGSLRASETQFIVRVATELLASTALSWLWWVVWIGRRLSEDMAQAGERGANVVEGYTLSVLTWAAYGDVGHTAIRIENTFYGYYPTDINGDGAYTKEDLANSPGEMHIQSLQAFTAHYSGDAVQEFELNVTTAQIQQVQNGLNAMAKTPGMYQLKGNNCTSVAIHCLKQAGIDITRQMGPMPMSCQSVPTHLQAPWDLQSYLSSPCNASLVKSIRTYTIGK
jgi:Domain of unknown function (DUF4105)